MGITFPPFGVVVRNDWWHGATLSGRRRLLRHEQCHWIQYKRMGLVRFYWRYMVDTLRYGYRDHPMEIEARDYAARF